MDDNLAFCLGQFIDEQVQIIDDKIDEIKNDEREKCRAIEKARDEYERKKPPAKNKGNHGEDQRLVDQFIDEMRAVENVKPQRNVLDDPTRVDALRAEIQTKVGACANYVTRLRGLAMPLPNSKQFVTLCSETIIYCKSGSKFQENFELYNQVLQETEDDALLTNTRQWWKDTYGGKVAEVNERNKKFNPAIIDLGFVTIAPNSRIMDNGRQLLSARKVEVIPSPKGGIIRRFVRHLLSLDEDRRASVDEEKLVEQLNEGPVDEAVNYARQWLKKRDEIRNHKEEDPYGEKLENLKADFGRQRIAQGAKKLALAALLCRLAVGSGNDQQFEGQLKRTVKSQNDGNGESIAIISGDLKELEVDDLPIIMQLITHGWDSEAFRENKNNIRQRLAKGLCAAFEIPSDDIQVEKVDCDNGRVHLRVARPHGKVVVDALNGNAPDAAKRMAAVKKCCEDLHVPVESITLGEFGLHVENRLMDPRFNKRYVWAHEQGPGVQYWAKPLDYGGKPYHCPSGWMRYGVKVAETSAEFDAKWGTWHMAYHGTAGQNASNILTSGLRVSNQGCFYEEGVSRVYVSPSIEYSAHPRYARPWKQTKDGKTVWYQMVFQCRVNPTAVAQTVGPETLLHQTHKPSVTIDPNFTNGELEWVILAKKGVQYIKDDIICYGLLVRTCAGDLGALKTSAWWDYCADASIYKTWYK